MDTAKMLQPDELVAVAEDIEYLHRWWDNCDTVGTTDIRHGSAVLRRLLVEDDAGRAWRQLGFQKEPKVKGPDSLAFYASRKIGLRALIISAAGGVRFGGVEAAFIDLHRADNPATGVPAMAERGFAVVRAITAKEAGGTTPSEMDVFIERTWYLHEYLSAPGLIRDGEILSRREVIKHMANHMGGVHLAKNNSSALELLKDTADKILFEHVEQEPWGTYIVIKRHDKIHSHFIEVLAIGQTVGRSEDFQTLARGIRQKIPQT